MLEKWIVNAVILLTKCRTELRVGCPNIELSGTSYIFPLTISVMAFTVAMIAAMIAPFLC